MTIRLNDHELEALRSSQLSHAARIAYVLVIRPAMDYRTGFAGLHRTISYQQLREILEYTPPAGSHRREIRYTTRQQLRAVIEEVERAGVIERIRTSNRGLVFRCRLADTDECVSTRSNPGATPEQPRPENPLSNPTATPPNNSRNIELDAPNTQRRTPARNPNHDSCCSATSNPPPVSGIREGDTTHTGDAEPSRGETAQTGVCDQPEDITRSEAPSSTTGDRFMFERFWAHWPKHKRNKKQSTYAVFRRKGLARYIDSIIKDVEERKSKDRRWRAGFIPSPDNYLRDMRWEEDIEVDRHHPTKDARPTSKYTEPTDGSTNEAQTFREAGFQTDPEW